jgi:hypothetical protein
MQPRLINDSYEMSGAGTFEAQNKSVKAAGTFTHKSPNGNLLETGVWLAGDLASFDSYDAAPRATYVRLGVRFRTVRAPSVCQCPQVPCRQADLRYSVSVFCQ